MRKGKTQEGKGLRILGIALLCIGILGAIMALVDGKISTAVVSVVVFVGGGLIALTKSNRPKKESEIPEVKFSAPDNTAKMNENPATTIKFTVSSSNGPIKHDGEPIKLTMIDLKGYKSPSGGYANCAEYNVSGYIPNPKTGNKNVRHLYRLCAKNEDDAAQKFKKKYGQDATNLVIELIPVEPATENQVNYIHDLGIIVPPDISKADASAILTRVENGERPLPSIGFAQLADKLGVCFSLFTDNRSLVNIVVYMSGERTRIAFYAYCVCCFEKHINPTKLKTAPDFSKYFRFADYIRNDDKFMRSLEKREASDYLKPNRNTDAYKAVADYFNL